MLAFEWWHWIVFGLILTMTELAIPAFFIVWFGVAAAGVGLILLIFPGLALSAQILVWTALSALLVAFWFRYLKPRTMTAAGTSADRVAGEVGILSRAITPQARGEVRFQKPVLGADSWECYAETAIACGERVRVVAVEGSFIKVERVR